MDMKTVRTILLVAAAFLAASACGPRSNRKTVSEPAAETQVAEEVETYFTAIDKYLADVIGTQYASGEVCIPFHHFVAVDETRQDDVQVWGDFWVDNYNVVGDTLLFVSGGSHPGRMHVSQDGEGHFTVTGFDAVGDGSEFLPTARAIFGDKFDAFQKAYSDQDQREEARKRAIASYVFRHGLPVKVYKDYGWPAVEIPEPEK
jgi:hypothetical protein